MSVVIKILDTKKLHFKKILLQNFNQKVAFTILSQHKPTIKQTFKKARSCSHGLAAIQFPSFMNRKSAFFNHSNH